MFQNMLKYDIGMFQNKLSVIENQEISCKLWKSSSSLGYHKDKELGLNEPYPIWCIKI